MYEYGVVSLPIPEIIENAYIELKNTPFYKIESGYAFASHTLQNEDQPTNVQKLLDGMDDAYYIPILEDVQALFRNAIETLSTIIIAEDDLTVWVSFRKERGAISEYHNTLEHIYQDLIVLFFESDIIGEDERADSISIDENKLSVYYKQGYMNLVILDKSIKKTEHTAKDFVLNHRNPFADVSIKDQQFLYASDYQQFEALSLNTSQTLTKIQKDEDHAYLALQPGFKIKKLKSIDQRQKQTVTFDNTLTTEIAQQDDNIYIYVD